MPPALKRKFNGKTYTRVKSFPFFSDARRAAKRLRERAKMRGKSTTYRAVKDNSMKGWLYKRE